MSQCLRRQELTAGAAGSFQLIERVKDGYKANMFMVVVFSGIITLIIFLFGPNLLNMFMDSGSNVQAINYGMEYMRIVSSFYILMGIN